MRNSALKPASRLALRGNLLALTEFGNKKPALGRSFLGDLVVRDVMPDKASLDLELWMSIPLPFFLCLSCSCRKNPSKRARERWQGHQ